MCVKFTIYNVYPMKFFYTLIVLFIFSGIYAQEELCNTSEKPEDEPPITLQELSDLILTPDFYNPNYRYLDGLGSRGGRYSAGFLDTWLGETQILFPYNGLPIRVNLTDTEIVANDTNYLYWMTMAMGQEYMNVDMQWMMGFGAKETFSGTPWAGDPFHVNTDGAFGPFEVELFTGVDRAISYPVFYPEYQTQLENALDINTSGIAPIDFMGDYIGTDPTLLDEGPVVSAYMLSITNFYTIYNWYSYAKDLCWHKVIDAPADPYYGLGAMAITYNLGVFSSDPIALTMNKDNYDATMNNPAARDLLPEGNSFYRRHITEVIEAIVERADEAATDASIPMWDYEIDWPSVEHFFLGRGGTINQQGKGGLLKHFETNNVAVKQDIMNTVEAAFDILKGKAPSTSANTISFRYDWLALLRTVKQHFSNQAIFERPTAGDGNLRINLYSNVGGCCEEDPEIEVEVACLNTPTVFRVLEDVDAVLWEISDATDLVVFSSPANPEDSFVFTVAGEYTITATITINGVVTEVAETITIADAPIANPASDYVLCAESEEESIFDLSTRTSEIIGSQVINDLVVTYHTTQDDADNSINTIDPDTAYTFVGDEQDIFARIFVMDSECFDTTSFTLFKNIINPDIEDQYAICNNGAPPVNNQKQLILLEDTQILITPGIFDTYSWVNEDTGVEFSTSSEVTIFSAGNYSLTVTRTIAGETCSVTKMFTVEGVDPIANPVSDYVLCVEGSDEAIFDLTTRTDGIIGSQTGDNLLVSYHLTLNDADNALNALTNVETYTFNGGQQEIFARIFVEEKGCYNTTSFTLFENRINPDIEEGYAFCNNSSDPLAEEVQITPGVFDTYSWTNEDTNTEISTNATIIIDIIGNYSLTITKIVAGETCTISRRFTIEGVDPIANLPEDYVICTEMNEIPVYDLSIKDSEVIGDQTGENLIVTYYNSREDAENGENEIMNVDSYSFQGEEQEIFARITVQDKGCSATTSFMLLNNNLTPNIRPQYTICGGDVNSITSELTVVPGFFDSYIWRVDGTGDIISSDPELRITEIGVYNLIVTKELMGTSCTMTSTFEVGFADLEALSITAELFQGDIVINVEQTGIYEYALDNAQGPYQDIPRFENVENGEHTVYVRTINGCIYSAEVEDVVVEPDPDGELIIPKYFTPNGDDFHETWKIIDPLSILNEGSKIYIYDRFGKLLKQLASVGNGWDGTYNGKQMPSSEYWFSLEYVQNEDTKVVKGHFSLIR